MKLKGFLCLYRKYRAQPRRLGVRLNLYEIIAWRCWFYITHPPIGGRLPRLLAKEAIGF
jgi:hypothetical protein